MCDDEDFDDDDVWCWWWLRCWLLMLLVMMLASTNCILPAGGFWAAAAASAVDQYELQQRPFSADFGQNLKRISFDLQRTSNTNANTKYKLQNIRDKIRNTKRQGRGIECLERFLAPVNHHYSCQKSLRHVSAYEPAAYLEQWTSTWAEHWTSNTVSTVEIFNQKC